MEIDSVILMAKCIKKIDGDKNIGNIDQLIASLESYRDNVGDIAKAKHYRFFGVVSCHRGNSYNYTENVLYEIHTRGVTENIIQRMENEDKPIFPISTLRGEQIKLVITPDTDDEIYDYIFDIESYIVSRKLEVELYRNGFNYADNIIDDRGGKRTEDDDVEYYKCCSMFYLEK